MSSSSALGLLLPKLKLSGRDEFIGSSFASSQVLSERILSWSGSKDRGRLFSMEFHPDWQHPKCLVMGWYKQQCSTSTTFRSVEHRRNADGPFYHEFLLFKLIDGAICRVERTGEGSRADAVRHVGCTAHDYIQWFSSLTDYDEVSARFPATVLIATIDLSMEFDILDVLAVCYSIRTTKACRVYTLQRYNCYFLCLTVLATLTRRVASWETSITRDRWDHCLASLLDGLGNMTPEDSKKYVILRMCTLLEPDNLHSAQFIIDGLSEHLQAQAGALTNYNERISSALWRASWESVLRCSLAHSLRLNVHDILENESYCGVQFRRAVHTSAKDSWDALQSSSMLAPHYAQVRQESLANRIERTEKTYKDLQQMWEAEHPVSFSRLVSRRMLGPLRAMLNPNASTVEIYSKDDVRHRVSSRAAAVKPRFQCNSYLHPTASLDTVGGSNEGEILLSNAADLAELDTIGDTLAIILDKLTSKGVLGSSEIPLVMANLLDKPHFVELLCSLVASDLGRRLYPMQEAQQTGILVSLGVEHGLPSGKTTTANFQEAYIKRRIDAHAQRVDANQLAPRLVVFHDIESTMAKVWTTLPIGFGGTVVPSDKVQNLPHTHVPSDHPYFG
ncbi:hypothetical protein FRC12_000756 [Ceratobasidium sp. 428]|nr:hypothetical protein FRC12_000756 [Ceratobasidium sp. 428]